MNKKEIFTLGILLGFIIAVVFLYHSYDSLRDCYNAYEKNDPPIVWVKEDTDPRVCYVIQEVNGKDIEFTLDEYNKLKSMGKQ